MGYVAEQDTREKIELNFLEIKEHYLRVGHCSSYNLVSLQYTIEI